MSNFPLLSNLSRPVMMALSGAVALIVVAALLFAAVPRGSDDADVEAQNRATTEPTELLADQSTVDSATTVATPDEETTGQATPAGAKPAAATLAASTPSALIGGGWGSGPEGDAGGMRSYPGPGPQGNVDVMWKLDIPEGYEAGSPIVYGNRLLVTATSEAFGSNLTVYELESGQFLWSYAENSRLSSPFVATGRVFVTADDAIVALSLETGEVLWTQQFDTGADRQNSDDEQSAALSNPVADGDAVIVAAGSGIVAHDAATGAERWRHEFAGTIVSWPRLLGDIVFVTSSTTGGEDSGPRVDRYHGLSLGTGNEIWRQDADLPLVPAASADAGVVLVADALDVRMFDARTGRSVTIAAPCAGQLPSAVGDTVACGSVDALTGESLEGADAWPEGSTIRASTGDTLYMTSDSRLVAVELVSGETRWSVDLSTLELDDGVSLVGTGFVSVGDNGLAIEVWLEDAESKMMRKAIWIVGVPSQSAATPVAGGTPVASPVANATPEGRQ